MRAVPYHAPSCDYHDYYLKQVGHGNLPVYSGFGFQRGAGIGNILGRLWLAAVPILKRGPRRPVNVQLKLELKWPVTSSGAVI